MKVGIVIDDWKLGTFEKILTESGFSFTHQGGPGKGVISLFVQTNDPAKLQRVVRTCQRKAAELKN